MLHFPHPPPDSLNTPIVANGGTVEAYQAGKDFLIPLDRHNSLMRLLVRLVVNVATGATPGTPTARRRNPASFLGTLRYIANGKELFSAPGDLLYLRAQWMRGRIELESDKITTAELANASQTYDASITLPIDFSPPDVEPSHVGIIPSSGIPSHALKGTWGQVADMMDSAGATQSISSVAVSVRQEQIRLNWKNRAKQDIPRKGFGGYRLDTVTTEVTSTRTEIPVELTGGGVYTRLFFRTSSGSTREVSDSVFTSTGNIKVKRGSTVLFEASIAELKKDTLARLPYGIDATGWYVIDFTRPNPAKLGFLSRAVAAPGNEPLKVLFDGTTATNARVETMAEQLLDPDSFAQLLNVNPQLVQ